MTKKLRDYFPMLQAREAILKEIDNNEKMWSTFYSWEENRQEEFLDFCTGARGIKVMYDFVSKEILNPESTPERIDELLSLLLKQEVHVMEVLPNDGTRLADEASLVIMDIVVQLSDGSIANLEIQKIGYKFPGERSACYSADLLLRQYKRVRSERKKKFSYKDIKDVYTIVLFENSPAEFKKFPDVYIHSFGQKSDSGLEFNLLQKYVFVALDNFRNIQQNKENKYLINSRLDAWIAFFCIDDPEMIVAIIEQYPEFRAYYEQIYDICRNIEGVMDMFSKELQELDRNTVQLMIDEMQEDLKQKGKELDLINQELDEKNQELDEKNQELDEKNQELDEKNQELDEKNQELDEKNQELDEKSRELDEKNQKLQAALARIRALEEEKKKANC